MVIVQVCIIEKRGSGKSYYFFFLLVKFHRSIDRSLLQLLHGSFVRKAKKHGKAFEANKFVDLVDEILFSIKKKKTINVMKIEIDFAKMTLARRYSN